MARAPFSKKSQMSLLFTLNQYTNSWGEYFQEGRVVESSEGAHCMYDFSIKTITKYIKWEMNHPFLHKGVALALYWK